ncbi:hypothetical protein LF1_58340 [Rubripirellula obstinata]|uniref:Uncharacterized protein n=1 Tax=Rubripirellula obstinata TaxID=406547 RepID=A0A5B1C9J4_9BACT|nr:hypothetical protein LF1_58340 [Rubripirellula obstinata]
MHRSGGRTLFSLLARQIATSVMHTVIRLKRGHLLPASRPAAYPMLDQNRFAPNTQSRLESRLPCGAPTDA